MVATKKNSEKLQEAVLGSILMNPALYFEVSDFLHSAMFTSSVLNLVADELFSEIDKKGSVNLIAFAHAVEERIKDNLITFEYIISLVNKGDTLGFIELCEQLKERYLSENEISLHTKALARLHSGENYSDVVTETQGEREMIYEGVERQKDDRLKDIQDAHDAILTAIGSDGSITGCPTGFQKLDSITAGWQPTDLVILAGRPGMGKSTLAFNYCLTASRAGKPSLIVSLEMSKKQVYQKIVSIITEVPTDRMRSGEISEEEQYKIQEAFNEIFNLPLYVISGISNIYKIKNKLRILKRKYALEICAIDYLQLANCGKNTQDPTQKVGEISNNLKNVASEEDCNLTMIALSQLNRSVETRGGDKRPMLSDLRQSGEIEQDADMVQFVYRAEYYGITENEEGQSLKNKGEIIIAKNRHGKCDTVEVGFAGRFYDLQPESFGDFTPTQFPVPENNLITKSQRNNNEDIPF